MTPSPSPFPPPKPRQCRTKAAISAKKTEKAARHAVLDEAVRLVLEDKTKNKGRSSHRFIHELVERYKQDGYDWMCKNRIDYHVRSRGSLLMPTVEEPEPSTTTNTARSSSSSSTPDNDAPRPNKADGNNKRPRSSSTKPMTAVQAKKLYKRLLQATEIAAVKFQAVKQSWNESGKMCPSGTLKRIVHETECEFRLEPGSISVETVRTRVSRKNTSGRPSQNPKRQNKQQQPKEPTVNSKNVVVLEASATQK
jgi:hypothetical protein